MNVIYEPKGAAREYSELACNLYRGCMHGCRYCYVPSILPFKNEPREKFHADSKPRKNILKNLERDAKRLHGDPREILFCFTSDPYQRTRDNSTTRRALEICREHELRVQVLTKGGMAASLDFDLMKEMGATFATSLCLTNQDDADCWEPHAALIESRIYAIRKAHAMGIRTWVSMEPVIDPGQALELIDRINDVVDMWKIGKLNHFPDQERRVDWKRFLLLVKERLHRQETPKPYLIKNALLAFE